MLDIFILILAVVAVVAAVKILLSGPLPPREEDTPPLPEGWRKVGPNVAKGPNGQSAELVARRWIKWKMVPLPPEEGKGQKIEWGEAL